MPALPYARRSLVLMLLIVSTISPEVCADGIYFPPAAFAVKPAIPAQRAMIIFRDGVETLIVESTYRSDAPDAGWIVPVPSPPTQIETADPGLLESLSWCAGPRVRNELHDVKGFSGGLLVLSAIAAIAGVTARKQTLIIVLGSVAVVLFFAACLLPALSTSGSVNARMGAVEQLQSSRVGNYEVQVIRAADSGALANWLAEQRLQSLQAGDRAIIDQYITDGWCFVVAHLTGTKSAQATPHPMALTFPVSQPVFPMRATALANSTTAVELFVVADQQASAKGFSCVLADQLQVEGPDIAPENTQRTSRAMVSIDRSVAIGHPDAVTHLWDGCVVTRLDATLKPGQMTSDVQIALSAFAEPIRQQLYGPGFRRDSALTVLFIGATVLSLMVMLVRWGGRQPLSHESKLLTGLAIAVVAAPVVAFLGMPVVAVRELRGPRFIADMNHSYKLIAADFAIREGTLDESLIDDMDRFPSILAPKYLKADAAVNPLTDEPMLSQRTPGNFMVIRRGDRNYLCLYDLAARETQLLLPAPKVVPPVLLTPASGESRQ